MKRFRHSLYLAAVVPMVPVLAALYGAGLLSEWFDARVMRFRRWAYREQYRRRL